MNKTYDGCYTISEVVNDTAVCHPWISRTGKSAKIPYAFLEAYGVDVNDSFTCQSDEAGGLLVDTLHKM